MKQLCIGGSSFSLFVFSLQRKRQLNKIALTEVIKHPPPCATRSMQELSIERDFRALIQSERV